MKSDNLEIQKSILAIPFLLFLIFFHLDFLSTNNSGGASTSTRSWIQVDCFSIHGFPPHFHFLIFIANPVKSRQKISTCPFKHRFTISFYFSLPSFFFCTYAFLHNASETVKKKRRKPFPSAVYTPFLSSIRLLTPSIWHFPDLHIHNHLCPPSVKEGGDSFHSPRSEHFFFETTNLHFLFTIYYMNSFFTPGLSFSWEWYWAIPSNNLSKNFRFYTGLSSIDQKAGYFSVIWPPPEIFF